MNNNVKKRSKGLTVRVITTSAVLVALEIVLNRFCSINTFGWMIGQLQFPLWRRLSYTDP